LAGGVLHAGTRAAEELEAGLLTKPIVQLNGREVSELLRAESVDGVGGRRQVDRGTGCGDGDLLFNGRGFEFEDDAGAAGVDHNRLGAHLRSCGTKDQAARGRVVQSEGASGIRCGGDFTMRPAGDDLSMGDGTSGWVLHGSTQVRRSLCPRRGRNCEQGDG